MCLVHTVDTKSRTLEKRTKKLVEFSESAPFLHRLLWSCWVSCLGVVVEPYI